MSIEHAYAEALRKVVEKGKSPKAAVTALRETLQKEGRTQLLPRIARAFKRVAEREHARNMVRLYVAGSGQTYAKTKAKHAIEAMRMDPKDVELVEDATLIGGWRLEGREQLHDASYKRHLLELYKRVTSS
ncbi:hypothetical protein C4585_00110 [Candidatus Parcubacteria bacterium]|nr:MAG: hypothetical protein C4585_00110 [Candidatus Parcubacteria bacterium]